MTDPEGALAMVAASTIVAAMATSAWDVTRARAARIFRRGDDAAADDRSVADIEARLERSASRIATAGEPEEVRRAQIVRWREDFEDLVNEHPDAEAELRSLVEATARLVPAVEHRWNQHVEARDGGFAVGAIGPGSQVVVHGDPERRSAGESR